MSGAYANVCHMARKRGREDAPRYGRYTFRLADDEMELIQRAALLSNQNVSSYLRGTALSASAVVVHGSTAGAALPTTQ